MALRSEFFRYLEAFKGCVPLHEFAANPEAANLITLRHDVDYSIDIALEMAFWEHRYGIRATYFLLHTAPYWDDPELIEKCRQLTDFGHEVGLHLNALATWYRGETDDVAADITAALERLRAGGIKVTGTAAHGDSICYSAGMINYWCFKELRPDDPARREHGLSAEGIAVVDAAHRIGYPPDHRIRRPDGTSFALWSLPMARFGLCYHAMHVPMDRYFTDSGGSWTRSPDPLTARLTRGRHQILMHPIHWRDLPRVVFFLSTARSGSLWLSGVLDRASSATGVHEFTLNHQFKNNTLVKDKRTFADLHALLNDSEEARSLILQSRDYIEVKSNDWAEANVYLVHFLDYLKEMFADAYLVYLHRHPKDVVRSLMNRDWYDTPEDGLHPPMPIADWPSLTQFERVCWYVQLVNERLLAACDHRLVFEEMTADPGHLSDRLPAFGLAFYPRLAQERFGTPVNVSQRDEFPPYSEWSEEQKSIFASICGPACRDLGYGGIEQAAPALKPGGRPARHAHATSLVTIDRLTLWQKRLGFARASWRIGVITLKSCKVVPWSRALVFQPSPRNNAHVLFGGGTWNALQAGKGWPVKLACWYRGLMVADLTDSLSASLFCLSYDDAGHLIDRRLLASFSGRQSQRSFAFRPRASAARFNVALYLPKIESAARLTLRRLEIFEMTSA